MEFENSIMSKVSKRNKKRKKQQKMEPEVEPELEPEQEPEYSENSLKKKKKKKRKSENRESDYDEPRPEPNILIQSETPPKLGRRSKGEVNNNTLSPSKSPKEENSDSSFAVPKEPSRKKRKSSSTDDTFLTDLDETMNSDFQSPSKKVKIGDKSSKELKAEWQKLLNIASEQVKPSFIPYSKSLQSIDYETIAEHFPHKSPEDVKNELLFVIEGTVKTKCLHQLLTEALDDINTDKNVASVFCNFVHMNNEKITEEMDKTGSGVNRMSVASDMWKKLTQKEKRVYGINYNSKKGDQKGQTSYEIFYPMLKTKEGKMMTREARQKWNDLPFEKKAKYIRKSAKKMMKALEEVESAKQEEGDEHPEVKVRGPSKDEAIAYLKHFGYPEEPTKYLPFYYCLAKEKDLDSDSNNRLIKAQKIFYELSKDKQEHWKEKHEKVMADFKNQVEEWKKEQDKVTLFIWKTFKAPKSKSPASKKKEAAGEVKSDSKFKVGDYIKRLTYHDVKLSLVKFDDEPIMPPLTPIKLFINELEKKKGEKVSYNVARTQYKALEATKKVALDSKSDEIKDVFIKGLKDYVENMSKDQRKLFLGVKRIKYIKALGEDIFEEDYPHTEYKVYGKPAISPPKRKRNPSTSPTKSSPEKEITDNEEVVDEEEEEEEDDEEEDMKNLPSPKKSKFIEPRKYSSREKVNVKKLASNEKSDEDDDDDEEDDDDDSEVSASFAY